MRLWVGRRVTGGTAQEGRRGAAAVAVLAALLLLGMAAGARRDGSSGWRPDADFDVLFAQDFEDDTVGPYCYDEWEKDWGRPPWSCPDWSHWATGAKMEIIQEGNNRFLRHRFDPGDFSTTGELGMQWETALSVHDEVYLSFRARCSDVFASEHLDGKLPGLKGKPAAGKASGGPGQRPGPDEGFSSRQMFKGGHGDHLDLMPYIYHQEMEANSETEDGKPLYYGNSFGPRPALAPNTWYTITQRLVMNDPQVSNGIAEFYVDGKLVSSHQGFRFRDTERVMIDTISMSNFLGGSGDRSTVQGYWDFDDIVVFAYKPEVGAPRGPVLSPAGRSLILPASSRRGRGVCLLASADDVNRHRRLPHRRRPALTRP